MAIEPHPTCISTGDLYPERRGQVELLKNELKSIIDSCRKNETSFSPPQFGQFYPRPEIIQLDPDKFAYIAMERDALCFQQLSRDEAKQILDESVDFLHRVGKYPEEEEMAELYNKLFAEHSSNPAGTADELADRIVQKVVDKLSSLL